jgi:HlyD family secretion protein
MKRVIGAAVVLALVLTGLITWKIRVNDQALNGPSGGSGTLEGVVVNAASIVAGRLVRVAVREGATVQAGEVLAEIDCSEPRATLAEAEARVAAARSQAVAARAQADAAARATGVARAGAAAARAQAGAMAAQQAVAERNADRMVAIGSGVAASTVDQTRSQADALAQQQRAAESSGRASAAQTGVAVANAAAARGQASAADEAVRGAESAVTRAQLRVDECIVRAPRAGVVETLPYEQGEVVPVGAPIARIVDTSELTATFYLPNAELAAAQVGARAIVDADALPGQHIEGRVVRVSSEAEFTPRNVQTRTDRDRLVFAVDVRITTPNTRLRPGMPVQVILPGTARRVR